MDEHGVEEENDYDGNGEIDEDISEEIDCANARNNKIYSLNHFSTISL